MEYRYINATGAEIRVEGAWGLVREIRDGRLKPDAMIFEDGPGRWVPAFQHPEYREAPKVIEEMSGAGAQHAAVPNSVGHSSFNLPSSPSMVPGPSSREPPDHDPTMATTKALLQPWPRWLRRERKMGAFGWCSSERSV